MSPNVSNAATAAANARHAFISLMDRQTTLVYLWTAPVR